MVLTSVLIGHISHKQQKMKILFLHCFLLLVLSITPGFARVLFEETTVVSSSHPGGSQDDQIIRTVEALDPLDGQGRLKSDCHSASQTGCTPGDGHEYLNLDIERVSLMPEVIEVKSKAKRSIKYSHPGLGEVAPDEPLLHFGVAPQSDDDIGTKFVLEQTTSCPDSSDERCVNKFPIDYKTILNMSDSLAPCQVLTAFIHGYNAGPDEHLNEALSRYHFQYYNSSCNLVIDWVKGAELKLSRPYLSAAANVITVGRQLGLLVYDLMVMKKVEPKDVHLIGHSLGAHVAHYASIWLRHLSRSYPHKSDPADWIPGRITGLDPAAPQFQGHPGTHLVKEDANFVDVIHTAAVGRGPEIYNLLRGRLGMSELVGSVDFFPNGGTTPQPPCAKETAITRFFSFPCSHIEALTYFRLSVFSEGRTRRRDEKVFPSLACNSTERLNSSNDTLFHASSADDTSSSGSMGMQAVNFKGRGRQCLRT